MTGCTSRGASTATGPGRRTWTIRQTSRTSRGSGPRSTGRWARPAMSADFQVVGRNEKALFTLKLHRGDGMALVAMNWKDGRPPKDFVGFAIEYREPGGDRFFPLKNRLAFPGAAGSVNPDRLSTMFSPIQKFRW